MSLRHALLGLLVRRSASGYDLVKLFDTSLAHVWPATQSQIYGELGKLADAGMLDLVAHGPRGRKEYALTDGGLAELRRWLTTTPPTQPRRNDTLLRVFLLDVLTPEQSLTFLHRQADQAAAHHTQLQQVLDSIDWTEEGALTPNGRLALEYGLRITTVQQDWARWAAQQITSRTSGNHARTG